MMKKILILSLVFYSIQLNGLTINDSGPFELGFDIVDTGDIITIAVSDVTLEMNNHVISGGTNGIIVNSGLSNIIIRNGSIQNLIGTGIIINSNCSNITIENVLILSCDVRGIDFAGAVAPSQIESSMIKNCDIQSCCQGVSGDFALTLSECTKVEVCDSNINCNGISSNLLSAVRLTNCSECDFKNINAIKNTGLITKGFELVDINGCFFTHCEARNNTGVGFTMLGFDLLGTNTLNQFDHCISSLNTATASAIGFNLSGTLINNLFTDCQALGNSGGFLTGIGAHIVVGFALVGDDANTKNNIFIDCVASANNVFSTVAGSVALGFFLDGTAESGKMIRCLSLDNLSNISFAVGLLMTGGVDNWEIKDCQFISNLGSAAATSFGILHLSGNTHLFTRNIAYNNGTTPANQFAGVPAGSVTTPPAPASSSLNGVTSPWTNIAIAV